MAEAIFKGHNLHAAARQVAAAAATLVAAAQHQDVSDSVERIRFRAFEMAGEYLGCLQALGTLVERRHGRDLATALLTALNESRLLEHVGRLLLLLPPAPGPGGQPAGRMELAVQQLRGFHFLGCAVQQLQEVTHMVGGAPTLTLPPLLGVCGLHALLAFGASTLAAADGGPRGLPRDPLLKPGVDPTRDFPSVTGAGMDAFSFALYVDHESPAPMLSMRARIRLALRTLQLASASARAERGAVQRMPQGRMRVDLSWAGGRRPRSQVIALLLPPEDVPKLASSAVLVVMSVFFLSGRAWAAEAGSFVAPLFTGTVHCLEALMGDEENMPKRTLFLGVRHLILKSAEPLLLDAGNVMTSAAALPALAAAVLEGGVVPLLETLFRAASDNPAGPEACLSLMILGDQKLCGSVIALLVHSPPRQAAAFLATLSKLLRQTPLGALLEPLDRDSLSSAQLPSGLWLRAVTGLLERFNSSTSTRGLEPAGAVDPAAPCSPFFVLSLAALQLLPVLSELTQGAVQVSRGGTAPARGRRPATCRTEERPVLPELVRHLLCVLAAAVRRAGLRGGGSPAAPNRIAGAALCLPFLVEEAGAVPLLGALLAALLRDGELPGVRPTPPDLLASLAECCVGLAAAYPERLLTGSAMDSASTSGGSGAGGGSGTGCSPDASASAAWSAVALRLLASRLRGPAPQLSEEVEALAATLEQRPTTEPPAKGSAAAAELAAAAERLAALWAEARSVLPPACSNPACASLAGDSEAGARLQHCSRCGRASYCCRQCQLAHWKAGHKEACEGGATKEV